MERIATDVEVFHLRIAGGHLRISQCICANNDGQRIALFFFSLPFETSAEHSAKSKRMMRPIGFWRGRRCHLLNALA
jgi:hypothetical protein